MHRALAAIIALALGFFAHAEEKTKPAPRKTVPIAGGWLLTAEKHDKTKTEGTRTLLLTATGTPTLKRASKVVNGVSDISAKADKIECDFVEKKLILSGSPEFRQVDPKTKAMKKTIVGEAATVIEIPLRLGVPGEEMKVTGPHKMSLGEDTPPAK